MNPQPSNLVGFLGLAVFFAVVLFYFLKELKFPTRRKSFLNTIVDTDDVYFPIGYVIDQPKKPVIKQTVKKVVVQQPTKTIVKQSVKVAPTPTKPIKAKTSPKPTTVKPVNKFSAEAVSGLVNLGFKTKEAEKVVESVIKEHNPSSLEELIRKCFAR
jgi:hypothetical protein